LTQTIKKIGRHLEIWFRKLKVFQNLTFQLLLK